jgi:Transposase DDE domain
MRMPSTGSEPAWTAPASGRKRGRGHRSEPDRGKLGSKYHLIVDRQGVPLAIQLSAANLHDSRVFESLIEAIPPIRGPLGRAGRPRVRPARLHADKAYDIVRCHTYLRRRGIGSRIARKRVKSSERLGRHRNKCASRGHRADDCLAHRLSPPRHPLRAPRQHPHRSASPHLLPDRSSLPYPGCRVVKPALSISKR